MLFKYLTDKNIPVTNSNFTKNTLVDQILEYWRDPGRSAQCSYQHQQSQQISNQTQHQISSDTNRAENFPINVMSRTFSNWFFQNFNENNIQRNDFWSDCSCLVRVIDNSGEIKEDSTITAKLVLDLLYAIKNQFNFYFNPNLSHQGTRGK